MKTLIKKIDTNNLNIILTDTSIDPKFINLDVLIQLIYTNDYYKLQNELEINDIKEFNDKQKVILSMFINKYININPIVSKYNKYSFLLFEKVNPLILEPIFRGFFVCADLFKKNKINVSDYKIIMQIGILPTFLEAFSYIYSDKIKEINIDFLQIISSKKNNNLYQNMINNFNINYPNVNHIISLTDFYKLKMYDLINSSELKPKYDLIIFDTYKNMSSIEINDISQNINTRYISSIINSKYILFQILFALNKLNSNGDLIILFPGYDDIIYQQLILILAKLFNNISYFSSEIDYSYRYFIIAKGFKSDKDIIKKLLNIIDQYSDNNILLNLFSEDSKILNFNMSKYLNTKFEKINSKLISINEYFKNEQFIKKIYYDTYFYQITNTYNLLNDIFDENKVNPEYYDIIHEYKIYLSEKLSDNNIYIYTLPKLKYLAETNKLNLFEYILENVNYDDFIKIFKPLKYLNIFDLMIFDKELNYNADIFRTNLKIIHNYLSEKLQIDFKINNIPLIQILNNISKSDQYKKLIKTDGNYNILSNDPEIKKIIDNHNITYITYIDWDYICVDNLNKINLFDELKDITILKFNLWSIKPLLTSIMYILSIFFDNVIYARSNIYSEDMYFIGIGLNIFATESNISDIYLKNLSKININYYLVSIDNKWINQFNEQISKFIMIHLIKTNRLKYISVYPEFISFYNNVRRNYKIKSNIF